MKILITLILLLISYLSYTQIVLSFPDYKIVYRGYTNKLDVATTINVKLEFIDLRCEGAKLIHNGDNHWTLIPFTSSDTLEIVMFNSKTNEIIDRFVYTVKNLPNPTLFFGAVEAGEKASRAEIRFFAKNVNSPINSTFQVIGGSVTLVDYDREFQLSGNKLGKDYTDYMMEYHENLTEGTAVKVKATVIGPDGIERVIFGEYTF